MRCYTILFRSSGILLLWLYQSGHPTTSEIEKGAGSSGFMSTKLRGVVFDYNLFHEERDDGDMEATSASDVALRLQGLVRMLFTFRVVSFGHRV